MIRHRPSACLSLLALLIIFFPLELCASINVSPFFSYESNDNEYTFQALGPILESSSKAFAIRPFYYHDKITSHKDIIYPLGYFTPESSRFSPVYSSAEDEDQEHTDLFPFFYGRYKEDHYWGVFPVYGTMEHRFGYKKARFVLLPLYAQTDTDEASTYTALWPVFSYSKGRLFKVFPVYGWKKGADSTHQFFLWPVFHHEKGPDDKRMDAALPLFKYDRGKTYYNLSILWPFFTYNRDYAANHSSIDFPWPLIRYASGAYEETKLFPFYWSKTMDNTYYKKTILWPIWSKEKWHYEDTGIEQENTTVLLTNRMITKTTPDGNNEQTIILWPFVYISKDAGKSQWHFPGIIPLYSHEGFNNTWGPVLSIAEGESDSGSSKTSILWKTIYMEQNGTTNTWALSFLASVTTTPEYRQWSFFSNMLNLKQRLQNSKND